MCFAFFELGGGLVCNKARTASSNLSGRSVRRSVLLAVPFFADRLFTDSLSAPAGQLHAFPYREGDSSGESSYH